MNKLVLLGLQLIANKHLYANNVTIFLVHRYVLSDTDEQLKYKDRCLVTLIRYDVHLYTRMKFL